MWWTALNELGKGMVNKGNEKSGWNQLGQGLAGKGEGKTGANQLGQFINQNKGSSSGGGGMSSLVDINSLQGNIQSQFSQLQDRRFYGNETVADYKKKGNVKVIGTGE